MRRWLHVPVKGGNITFEVDVTEGTDTSVMRGALEYLAANGEQLNVDNEIQVLEAQLVRAEQERVTVATQLIDAKRAHEADKKRWQSSYLGVVEDELRIAREAHKAAAAKAALLSKALEERGVELIETKNAHEADKRRWNDINGGLALPVTESERWNAAHSLETARRENKQLRDRQEMYIRDNKDLAERLGAVEDELRVAREAHKAAAAKASADLDIVEGQRDALKVSLDVMHRRAQKAEGLVAARPAGHVGCERELARMRAYRDEREVEHTNAMRIVREGYNGAKTRAEKAEQKLALVSACGPLPANLDDLVKERDALRESLREVLTYANETRYFNGTADKKARDLLATAPVGVPR